MSTSTTSFVRMLDVVGELKGDESGTKRLYVKDDARGPYVDENSMWYRTLWGEGRIPTVTFCKTIIEEIRDALTGETAAAFTVGELKQIQDAILTEFIPAVTTLRTCAYAGDNDAIGMLSRLQATAMDVDHRIGSAITVREWNPPRQFHGQEPQDPKKKSDGNGDGGIVHQQPFLAPSGPHYKPKRRTRRSRGSAPLHRGGRARFGKGCMSSELMRGD